MKPFVHSFVYFLVGFASKVEGNRALPVVHRSKAA